MLIYRVKKNKLIPIPLKRSEVSKAHEICLRDNFKQDFVNRYRERCMDRIGLCNLPTDHIEEQQDIFEQAYTCYQDILDCNVAYNDTLDTVIDIIEKRMKNGEITLIPQDGKSRIAIVIEDGIISAAYSSLKDIDLEIVELDKNYATSEQRNAVYDSYCKDPSLSPCEYCIQVPGYVETIELEVED